MSATRMILFRKVLVHDRFLTEPTEPVERGLGRERAKCGHDLREYFR